MSVSTSGKRVDFPPVWSCIYVESTVSGQPAPLVHHNAGLISSSIKEHRLRLSLLTYSMHTSLLFEQWWTDVWSMDGLSYCITSAGRRIKKKKKNRERKDLICSVWHSLLCHKADIWVNVLLIIFKFIIYSTGNIRIFTVNFCRIFLDKV